MSDQYVRYSEDHAIYNYHKISHFGTWGGSVGREEVRAVGGAEGGTTGGRRDRQDDCEREVGQKIVSSSKTVSVKPMKAP